METAFDIISLVLFIVVILLAFFRKVNVGVVAVTFGVIMAVSYTHLTLPTILLV